MASARALPYDLIMRASIAAMACALGATCTSSSPPKTEDDLVMHAPIDITTATPRSMPTLAPPVASPESGPFWEPDATGQHAVPILRGDAPNIKYAAMDRATCEAELGRRNVAFVRVDPPPEGVLEPVRLRGPLSGGVTIHSQLNATQRETSPMEIFDCRLVLALDDFSGALAKRGISEMVHFSAYRSRAQFGCTPKYDGKQHCGALAVDVGTFRRKDGSTLDVLKDFHGRVGQPTCISRPGGSAPGTPTASSTRAAGVGPNELWTIVCDAADKAMFNVILTPNFNAQHANHIHLEVTPDAAWMLVH